MNPFSFDRSVVIALRALLAALFCAALLSGCANKRGGTVPYDRTDFGMPDAQNQPIADSGRIGALDTLNVSVYQLPDLTRDTQVDAAGNISLPLLGTIHAEGKTPDQLTHEISTMLAAKYVRQPDVQVVIKQASAQTVTVEGAVQGAGIYPIGPSTTLIQAIALAKGTTQDANPRRVVVFRTISGVRNAAAFDLTAIRRAEAPDPAIFGNDIIVVDGGSAKSRFQTIMQTIPLIALFRPF